MKKSTKLISLLLVLVILLSIIPMAVAADTTYKIGRNTCDDATIAKGAAPAGAQLNQNLSNGTVSKKIGETGLFKRLPRYTTPDYDLLANEYIVTDNAVTLSDSEVIGDLEFSVQPGVVSGWSGTYPCIEFNYRALKAGKTDVSLKYYYKIDGLPGWYYDLVTFTVNVSTTQVQKPSKPTGAGFIKNGAAVYMRCKDLGAADIDHDAWFKYVWNVSDGYSFGDIVPNDSSVASKGTYPWVCSMTINANKYLDAYNYQLSGECGTHYLAKDMPETRTVLFYYNAADSQWQFLPGSAPIYIDITHTAPTPGVTEYTVTYTDGVEDEEVFADQTYTVKEGDATPAFNGTPEREGYVFLGWGPEVAETVTGNATYTATWEEALTEVKVTSSISEGALLYLGSEFKVTATANTDAKLTFNFEANPAFKQIASDATGNSKTVWYRVVKITGNYTKINVSVTGTKGNQEPVTGTLSFGVNLRNRIHVTIKNTAGEIISNVTNIKLNHKYPKWNACPALKYDAAKQEYVMKNPWDLSSQEFVSVTFEYDGETYETKVTRDGENIFDVIRAGEREIYVEYTIVDPIYLTIEVDGVNVVGNEKYKGQKDEKMDYFQKLKEVQQNLLDENKTTLSMATYVDGQLITGKYTPLFGANKTVKIVITTNA